MSIQFYYFFFNFQNYFQNPLFHCLWKLKLTWICECSQVDTQSSPLPACLHSPDSDILQFTVFCVVTVRYADFKSLVFVKIDQRLVKNGTDHAQGSLMDRFMVTKEDHLQQNWGLC